MKKLQGVRVQYLHASSPPLDIKMDVAYLIELDGKKIYINDGEKRIEIRYEVLIQLFVPINCSWDELLKEDIKVEEVKLDK